ncbi:hypothetical protein D9613_002459 [Agrocybe pediades]|uniref:Uncharacterized protein n=1 Tax=Agrocybe pediades TaxID=84607 RepID=A0A8H4QP26_9AGAR|nr:hypothetical protein D9613_002459 [Agrocybe pediades]
MTYSPSKRPLYMALALTTLLSAVLLLYQIQRNRVLFNEKARVLSFDVPPMDLVAMTITDTTHYDLNDKGSVDFASLMPSGGHTIHITGPGSEVPETFTVALFHQLKCLEIYHREYLKPVPRQVTAELRGCLNYLRQSLLCHANTRLESIKNDEVKASKQYDTVCRDWTKVYEAAERNYAGYCAWDLGRSKEGG